MAKRNHPSAARGSESNLLIAVMGLVTAAALAAIMSAWIAGFVLDQLQSTEAMAMIITDGGIKSDSKDLERNLSSATLALQSCRDLGWALGVGCLGVGLAVVVRLRKKTPPRAS
jgi:hypothetical protein